MKKANALLRKIVRLQREYKLIPPHTSLLIALSGGVDSVVLTHAILELSNFFRFKRLSLAHFNHMLREESEQEEEFCKALAQKLGLEIFIGGEDVRHIAKERKKNLEETARELRYTFLRKVKKEEGFDLIATAHHLNDLLETAIIWLTRGAGPDGLIGFEPLEADVVRPLYRATREEILLYARERNLSWVEDKSNYELDLFRNRVRHEVIPVLKSVNPNLEESFLRTRTLLKDEIAFVEEIAKEKLKTAKRGECIEVKALRNSHVAIQRRVIKEFLSLSNFSKVEQVRRLLFRGGEIKLSRDTKVVRSGKLLCLKKIDS